MTIYNNLLDEETLNKIRANSANFAKNVTNAGMVNANSMPIMPEMQDWMKDFNSNMDNFSKNMDTWGGNEPESGLFGWGTKNNWDNAIGAIGTLGSLYGLSLRKDALEETKRNNAANLQLAQANYGHKYDTMIPNFLEAQGKATAIGDWVATQGGDSSKFMDIKNLALPERATFS